MGLTFSVGVGVVAGVLALASTVVRLLKGAPFDPEIGIVVVGSAVWSFPIGVAFSLALALAARGRSFRELSLPGFAALGAGAGLLLFGVLALKAWSAWSAADALTNAILFTVLGAGSATATLLLARRAGRSITAGDASVRLERGGPDDDA
jgi:hypothetical protein